MKTGDVAHNGMDTTEKKSNTFTVKCTLSSALSAGGLPSDRIAEVKQDVNRIVELPSRRLRRASLLLAGHCARLHASGSVLPNWQDDTSWKHLVLLSDANDTGYGKLLVAWIASPTYTALRHV